MDFVNLQLGLNLSIESRPCFPRMASQRSGSSSPSSGDPYNSEKTGASCWSPRTWHTDGNFGLRAEGTAPRSFAPCDTGRPIRVRTRREVRFAGLTPLPVALQPCRGADPSLNTRPACSALSQHAVTLPALRFASHSIAPQTASACPGTTSAFFFGTSDRFGIMPQGRHTGITTDNQAETARVAVRRGSTDPVLICGKSHAVLRGTSPDYGGRSKWAYSSLGSGVCARATPFCPFLAKTGGSRWGLVAR